MTDKRIKSYLEDRLKRLESIRNKRKWTTAELGDAVCCKKTLAFIDSLQEEPVSESIDFEKELYKAFGQVKDFTLGMRIAKWFYDMGKNSQELVSNNYSALLPCIYNRTLEERVKYCKYCSAACEGRVKESVSEDTMTIRKEWFEHCKESWYNEGYIDGKYNRDRQFKEPVSEELEEACEQLAEDARKHKAETSSPFFSQTDYRQGVMDGAKWQIAKLMANATEVTVHIDAGGYPYIPQMELYDYDKDIPLAKEGDKYKVILIKEE